MQVKLVVPRVKVLQFVLGYETPLEELAKRVVLLCFPPDTKIRFMYKGEILTDLDTLKSIGYVQDTIIYVFTIPFEAPFLEYSSPPIPEQLPIIPNPAEIEPKPSTTLIESHNDELDMYDTYKANLAMETIMKLRDEFLENPSNSIKRLYELYKDKRPEFAQNLIKNPAPFLRLLGIKVNEQDGDLFIAPVMIPRV